MTCIEIQKAAVPVDFNPNEQSLTRCELIGILAAITAVERVTLGQAKVSIPAGCDGAASLAGIRKWTQTSPAIRRIQGAANADILL